jgi:deazaflavin-dependent oxidoreductase (nitroreductase family)
MADSQKNEAFVEPSREDIIKITRQHVNAMENTSADEVWILAGMHQLILYTIGRKSGQPHTITVPYWTDANGHRIVVASFAGAKQHPAWYLNLTDKKANGEVKVRTQTKTYWSRPEILDGDDYERTWAALTADRAFYNDYQSRCVDSRRIPLIRLPETRSAS